MSLALPFPEQSTWFRWSLILGAVGLLAYSVIRAATLSITFDEAWTFNDYVNASWADIFSYKKPAANHHLLNTVLTKLSTGLFGLSEFSLRLPNVLAHAVFLWFGLQLLQHFRTPLLLLTGFALLNLDPYLLDFFSLARGYGLAMAASMASLNYLVRYLRQARSAHLYLALTCGALAVLANFSLLHLYLAELFVLGLATLLLARQAAPAFTGKLRFFSLRAGGALLITSVLALIMYRPVQQLLSQDQFYYGGKTGFWADTVTTSAYNYLYRIDYWKHDVTAVKWFIGASLLLMLAAGIYQAYRSRFKVSENAGLFLFLVLLLPAISSIGQHHLTGANYLLDRTALLFHPLFLVALCFGLGTLAQFQRLRNAVFVLCGVLSCLILLNANHALNLQSSVEWRYDACTKAMLADLERLHAGHPEEKIKLGISWQFRLSINFYREQHKIDWLLPVTAKGCKGDYDYYYVLGKGKGCKLPKAQLPFWEQENRKILYHYPRCNSNLGLETPPSISKR